VAFVWFVWVLCMGVAMLGGGCLAWVVASATGSVFAGLAVVVGAFFLAAYMPPVRG
jgi:hypothetical protein